PPKLGLWHEAHGSIRVQEGQGIRDYWKRLPLRLRGIEESGSHMTRRWREQDSNPRSREGDYRRLSRLICKSGDVTESKYLVPRNNSGLRGGLEIFRVIRFV